MLVLCRRGDRKLIHRCCQQMISAEGTFLPSAKIGQSKLTTPFPVVPVLLSKACESKLDP